jgi:hypothetical protein
VSRYSPPAMRALRLIRSGDGRVDAVAGAVVVMACPSQVNGASGWVTGLAHVMTVDVPSGALER